MKLEGKFDATGLMALEHPNGTRIWVLRVVWGYALEYYTDQREALEAAVRSFRRDADSYQRRCPGRDLAQQGLLLAQAALAQLDKEAVQGQTPPR